MFKKATKAKSKLRMAIQGPAGSGKSYTSLLIAKALGKKIAAIDTEHSALSKYSDLADFDEASLETFDPREYMKAMAFAASAGYDVLIIDSLSHAWSGKDGVLETVDKMGGNRFTNGWKTMTPIQNDFTEKILGYPGHIIATMRSKTEYVLETDPRTGKVAPRKVGMAPIQRDSMPFEFDVILDASLDGTLTVTKCRVPALTGGIFRYAETAQICTILQQWLDSGITPPTLAELLQAVRFANTLDELNEVAKKAPQLTDPAETQKLRDSYSKRREELANA